MRSSTEGVKLVVMSMVLEIKLNFVFTEVNVTIEKEAMASPAALSVLTGTTLAVCVLLPVIKASQCTPYRYP